MTAALQRRSVRALLDDYRAGRTTPAEVLARTRERFLAGDPAIWISVAGQDALDRRAAQLSAVPDGPSLLPLYGIPVAVKDNIDVAGMVTTAACPSFAYRAAHSATAVRLLEAAGAVVVGKTNLDQFATGLVGTRSPYGVPRNPAAPAHIPGGSSSGSAVAVASGQVPLALGTDTAGSGRVPAAMNGIAGWKPTRGIVSATGVVPACRSLDCVSVFAGTAADLRAAVDVLARHDPDDAHARTGAETLGPAAAVAGLRVGVPDLAGLDVDAGTRASLGEAVRRLSGLGVEITPVDLSGVLEAGRLLYHGPWLAERLEAAGELMERDDGALLDVTRRVLAAGREYRAVDVFRAQTRVRVHAAACERLWRAVDILVVPSVPAAFTLAEVAADPIGVNERLGTFTNFVNLLDLAAVAMPVGLRADGVPAGVTLVGPALTDLTLLAVARAFAGGDGMPEPRPDGIPLAVVGAHLRGQPLHHELRDAGAHFLQRTRTAPRYRLYALSGTAPPKPGMVEVHADGAALEVEVYTLAADAFGRFVAGVRSPLYIGPVELADGRVVSGFRCGTEATAGSTDITRFGGWRAYLAAR